MMNKDLSLKPTTMDENAWWYEDHKGFTIVHRIYDSKKKYIRTDQLKIPWGQIRKALARKDKT